MKHESSWMKLLRCSAFVDTPLFGFLGSTMAKKHPPFAPEFRRKMIELVRAGCMPEELATEFEPSAQAIRNWVAQVDRDEGRREDGLTTAEREELNRLRRENRKLKLDREIRSGDGCDPAEGFQFVSGNRARYPIAVMCRILGVSLSGYCAWVKRPACARALMDIALMAEIRAAHPASKGTYGAPLLQIDLAESRNRAFVSVANVWPG
jgi:transposase